LRLDLSPAQGGEQPAKYVQGITHIVESDAMRQLGKKNGDDMTSRLYLRAYVSNAMLSGQLGCQERWKL
jgi:hypothetical protein